MRIVLTPAGSAGDVFPFLGIGRRLRARGHEVVLVTAEPFRAAAERAGLAFEPHQSAEAFERIIRNPDLWHPTRGIGVLLRSMAEATPDAYAALERVCDEGTLLVGHSLSWVTRAYEELHGLAAVTVHLAPIAFRSAHELPSLLPGRRLPGVPRWVRRAFWRITDRWYVDRHIAEPFNRWRASMDLPPVTRFFDQWVHSPQRTIGAFPSWFHAPAPDWPPQVQLTTFPLYDDPDAGVAPALDRFLADGPPPILLAAGSANAHASRFFRVGIEATRRLGLRAIAQTSYPAQLPDPLPAHVHHAAFAPYSRVLPRCAGIVHHAGIGTCAQGLAAGIPQVTVPLAFDQPDNTDHLIRLGVADWLPPIGLRAGRLTHILDRLLHHPTVRSRCERYRDLLHGVDPLEDTCDLIEATGRAKHGP